MSRGALRPIRTALALFLLLAATPAAPAASDGPALACYEGPHHLVVGRDFGDRPGSAFLVFDRLDGTLPDCVFDPAAADWTVNPDEDPLFFEAIEGVHLVLAYRHGAATSVVAYNLATRQLVLEQEAREIAVVPGGIRFWQHWGRAAPADCPDAPDTILWLDRFFDLTDETISPVETAARRCAP